MIHYFTNNKAAPFFFWFLSGFLFGLAVYSTWDFDGERLARDKRVAKCLTVIPKYHPTDEQDRLYKRAFDRCMSVWDDK